MTYRVTGRQMYLGYLPGQVFVADLTPEQESRALARGAIEVIDRSPVTVDPGRVWLPETRDKVRGEGHAGG